MDSNGITNLSPKLHTLRFVNAIILYYNYSYYNSMNFNRTLTIDNTTDTI